MILFSVIIPVFDDWDRLELCISALERQSLSSGEFEIIIANNESEPLLTPDRLPSNARVVDQPAPGSYIARNTAVFESKGRYLAFTDSDCIPRYDWLENGLRVFQKHPSSRVAGKVSIFREEGGGYYPYIYDFETSLSQEDYVRAGYCATANLLVARDVFDRVGPFDLVTSGGDTRWNLRAQSLGVPIKYAEDVVVHHPARATMGSIFKKRRRLAGARALDVEIPSGWFLVRRFLPPVRRLMAMLKSGTRPPDAVAISIIIFLANIIEALEFLLVRTRLKNPNRS